MNIIKDEDWNRCQYTSKPQSKMKKGHYESYFLRANHPSKAEAFWIRYTIFSPKNAMKDAVGELWAIYFNGETEEVVAVKEEIPMSNCQFSPNGINVRVGEATLAPGQLTGAINNTNNNLSWELGYKQDGNANDTLLFLPKKLYQMKLPKAKAIVGQPNALFNGTLTVNNRTINLENWRGSENHNWGSQHTDEYAWGQVAGFDDNADAFLECITARIKIGPFWSPELTIAVFRMNGKEYRFNTIKTALKAQASYGFFDWSFKTTNGLETLEAHIQAPRKHFIGLTYNNPPGGTHTCLNTKIASCSISLTEKNGKAHKLTTKNRAAFELLTDLSNHGVPVVA